MASPMERIDDTISKHRVAIFSKSYCPYCNQVKKLFQSLGVDFFALELDLLGDEGVQLQDALFEKTNQKSVPNVFIRGNHIGGCDSTLKAHSDGRLHNLLEGTNVVYDYDLIVIGGGSGGLAASKEAATLGRKVAVCDFVVPTPIGTTWGLGGTCVNVGCIPKKLMHQAAIVGSNIKDGSHYGWQVPAKVEHDWTMMVEEIQQYIKSLNWGYRVALKDKGVTYLNALAEIIDPHRLRLTDKKNKVTELTTRHVIIAVGGRPTYPDIPGAREYGITSDDIFSLPKSPGKTLLIGASYIALECAGFLAGLGYDVTVMVRSILLRGFDQQIANMIGDHMKSHGVKFIEGCVPTAIEKVETDAANEIEYTPPFLRVAGTKTDGSEYSGEFNTVVFAIGREACTKNLGLVAGEVAHNKRNGKIFVDEKEQTSAKNIFAIGDVLSGKPELTPVAIQAGRLLAKRLYDNRDDLMDYLNIPTTVFTPLEYGCVGFSEEAAIEKYGQDDVEVYHSHFQPLEYALGGRDPNSCYAKLICVKSQGETVVGFHYLGPDAGEITQGFAIAVKLKAKKADFAALVGIHPTCAEVFTTMSVTKASGESVEKTGC